MADGPEQDVPPTDGTKNFTTEEDGAVTVDWVVLTAAIVGLAATGGSAINAAITSLGGDIADEVSGKQVANGD